QLTLVGRFPFSPRQLSSKNIYPLSDRFTLEHASLFLGCFRSGDYFPSRMKSTSRARLFFCVSLALPDCMQAPEPNFCLSCGKVFSFIAWPEIESATGNSEL